MAYIIKPSPVDLAAAQERFAAPVHSDESLQAQRDVAFDRAHSVDSWVKNPRRLAALGLTALTAVVGTVTLNKPIHELADHVVGGQDRQAHADQAYLDKRVKPDVKRQLGDAGIHLTDGPLPPQTP